MNKTSIALLVAAAASFATVASAAPALRVQVTQHGDFVLIGNSLGIDCAAGTPAPVVGTIGVDACTQINANNVSDSSPDLYWRSDAPVNGQATAEQATTAAQARSTANLTLPAGASVTHAFLYWAAAAPTNVADPQVTFERVGGFSQVVNAVQSFLPNANNAYQSIADVTAIVQQAGSGAYRISGIDVAPFVNVNNNNVFGGWSMVVFYSLASEPLRRLVIFDGLDIVQNGGNQSAILSGFRVPAFGFTGKLGVIAYEGDNSINGDQLFFNGGVGLSDAQNPINNVFNGTRSTLGVPVNAVGDLPRLTGTPQSLAGLDLDVFDVTAKLVGGQTSANVVASSTGDVYFLGAFITSISTFEPSFSTSIKTVTDLNGLPAIPGDVLEYSIQVQNTGNDASLATVLQDVLPSGLTYQPGSLDLSGAKTDAAGDDVAEYVAATRTLTARLGTGANATVGGSLALGQAVTLRFKATIDPAFAGNLANQASISAAGLLGSPEATTLSDGDPATPGASPTSILVDQCASNANCGGATPVCALDRSPALCVGCLADSDCGGVDSGLVCNTVTETCQPGCRGTDGNGCAAGLFCSSPDATIGVCDHCLDNAHCMNPTPLCDPSNVCAACAADPDCAGNASGELCALEGAVAGSCVRCTASDESACAGTTPVCDDRSGSCVACVLDTDCTDPAAPRCDPAAHACVACLGAECVDAGAPDAGTPTDAGTPVADAGSRAPDSGTRAPDASVPTENEEDIGASAEPAGGGCSCRTTPSPDAGGKYALAGLLVLAATVRRRRRS